MLPKKTLDVFRNLEGVYEIKRTIAPHGTFIGRGRFERNQNNLAYHEIGDLTLDNGAGIQGAEKRYLYKFEQDTVAVYFADGVEAGKMFHRLEFIEDDKAIASHLCGDDFYETTYQFNLPNHFSITHKVMGKKKDYVSVSSYKKIRHSFL